MCLLGDELISSSQNDILTLLSVNTDDSRPAGSCRIICVCHFHPLIQQVEAVYITDSINGL